MTRRFTRTQRALALALLAAVTLPAAAAAAPAGSPVNRQVVHADAAIASALPATTCDVSSPGHPACDLWAKAGTTDLPGGVTLPTWGFVPSSGDSVVKPGGPTLVVDQGDQVTITMHNALPNAVNGGNEALSLMLPEAPLVPDTTGVTQGNSSTYTFTATTPGTTIYEAGPTENARHQVAMGLYGALVVRPPGLSAATLTTAIGPNADLVFTAGDSGVDGNAISITYVDPAAPNSPLSVSVTGTDISVSLATDATGGPVSTASEVMAAINADPAASTLVTVTLAGGSDGSGVVSPLGPANLAGGQSGAYGTSTAFDAEALLVLGEIDPALNNAADPSGFDMKGYKASYWLINGRTYHDGGSIPSTDLINAARGDTVLLRYVNAGLDEHSMSTLGLHQHVIANDALPLTYSYQAVAETVGAGATMDTLVTMPSGTGSAVSYPVSDQGQHLDLAGAGWSSSASAPVTTGGMMTFVRTPDTLDTCAGPSPVSGSATPDVTDGTTPVAISATFSACTPASAGSPKTVTDAEYFVDTLGGDGSGTAITIGSPASTVVTGATIDPSSPPLAAGPHTVFIHARDSAGTWGGFDAETFFVDEIGPDSIALALTPAYTNGTSGVAVSGTATDLLNGDQNISAAEFRIDSTGAAPTAMTVTTPANAISAITGTIPQATVSGLGVGAHTIYVRSRDAFNNWGAFASTPMVVDKNGPTGSNASIGPSPNNGTISIDPNSFELQVEADFADPVVGGVNSPITRAEGFLDTVGADGSGLVLLPSDGAFDSPTETAYMRFPLAQINALSQGPHVFSSHARDAAGNWGAMVTATLIVDKTGPAITAGPAVAAGTLTATATDPGLPGPTPGSVIVGAEWYDGADPGQGLATPMTATDGSFNSNSEAIRATLPTLSNGTHTLSVRALDAAGNWGPVAQVTVTISNPVVFANSFAAGNLSAWSSATGGSAISATAAAKLHGADQYGLQASQSGTASRFVLDNSPALESQYSARFYFNPHGALPGSSSPTILAAIKGGGGTVARVQYSRTGAGVYRIRAGALSGGSWKNTSWHAISNAAHAVEVDWKAGAGSGSLKLLVDGALKHTLGSLVNGSQRIDKVKLGPSDTLAAKISGVLYFDDFVSTRGGTIGP